MRKTIKKNKARLEALIKIIWLETQKGTVIDTDIQRRVVHAIKKTLEHLDMEDYLYGSNHSQFFGKVYLSVRYNKENNNAGVKIKEAYKTRFGLAQEMCLGENTLGRYTNIYIKCFEKNLDDLLNRDEKI